MNYKHKIAILSVSILGFMPMSAMTAFHTISDVTNTTKEKTNDLVDLVKEKNKDLKDSIKKSVENDTDKVLQAIKVMTKQTSASTQEMSAMDLKNKIDASSIAQGISMGEQITKTHLDYGGGTGQGYNLCYVLADAVKTKEMMEKAKINTISIARETDNVGGRLVDGSQGAYLTRSKAHREKFCSDNDVQNGMCKQASALPNADVNVSTLNTPAKKGTAMDEAKTAFRTNLLGEPDKFVKGGDNDTSRAYLIQTNQRQARLAPASYSMAYLQAMSTIDPNILDDKGQPMSPNDKIQATVNRYYGSDESKEWLKSMMAQQPRGLLVEQAKMAGVESYLRISTIQSKERQLMMLASLVATSYEQMDKDMQKQYVFMRRNN